MDRPRPADSTQFQPLDLSEEGTTEPTQPPRRWWLAAGAAAALTLTLVALGACTMGRRGASSAGLRGLRASEVSVGKTEEEARSLLLDFSWYHENISTAMALLSKLAYCGVAPGLTGSVAYNCGRAGLPGVQTPCEHAGFVVTPGTVQTVKYSNNFAYTAHIQSLVLPGLPGHKDGFLIVFRGSEDTVEDNFRDTDVLAVELEGAAHICPGARVVRGTQETWQHLAPGIVYQLDQMAWGHAPVTCTGHGAGGAVCALALFMLKKMGYEVMGGTVFSMPHVGNEEFRQCLSETLGEQKRIFRVTNGADKACNYPPYGAVATGQEVHYTGSKSEVCTTKNSATCGCPNTSAENRSAWGEIDDTCGHNLAPEASFCKFGSYHATCELGQGFLWTTLQGAPSPQPEPLPEGLNLYGSTHSIIDFNSQEERDDKSYVVATDAIEEDSTTTTIVFGPLQKLLLRLANKSRPVGIKNSTGPIPPSLKDIHRYDWLNGTNFSSMEEVDADSYYDD